MLSADDRPETVLGAIDRGAAGFIPRVPTAPPSPARCARCSTTAMHLPRQALLGADTAQADDGEALGLSPRQVDVLRLLVEGAATR